jgi:alkyl sulfatase BDS1-like metallo-beta-lactamase superfamily hydrolase
MMRDRIEGNRMATVAECEAAFEQLAQRLADADPAARKRAAFDRTLSCTLRDLDVIFAGRLHEGLLLDIHQADSNQAQIRMTMSSDDLLKLVDGKLNMATAWASGQIKVDASMFDLLKLRNVF